MMFRKQRQKLLEARIYELEKELESKREIIRVLEANCDIFIAERHSACEHEYQMVCACVLPDIEPYETGGMFSSVPGVTKTFFHPAEHDDSDTVAIYAHRCKKCHHLKPATCFDVAAEASSKWVEYEGAAIREGHKYMVCESSHKPKPVNKLDAIVAECENYKTSKL
jgi:hypothetical protein